MERNQKVTPSTSQLPQQSFNASTKNGLSASTYSDKLLVEQHLQLVKLPMDKYSLNASALKYKKIRRSKKYLAASCMKQRERYVTVSNGAAFTPLYQDRKLAANRIYVCNSDSNISYSGLSTSTVGRTSAGSFIMLPNNYHGVRMFKPTNLRKSSLMQAVEQISVFPKNTATDSINNIATQLKESAQRFEKHIGDKGNIRNDEITTVNFLSNYNHSLSENCNLNVDSAKLIDDLLDMEEEHTLHSNMTAINSNSPHMNPAAYSKYHESELDMFINEYAPDLSDKFDDIPTTGFVTYEELLLLYP